MFTEVTTSQEEKCTVMLQVNTLPVIVTVGQAATTELAIEEAAKHILYTFREMSSSASSSTLL